MQSQGFRITKKSDHNSSKKNFAKQQQNNDDPFKISIHASKNLDTSKLEAFRQTVRKGYKKIAMSNYKGSPILPKKMSTQKTVTTNGKRRNKSVYPNNVEFDNVKWISIVSAYDPKKLQYVSATKKSLETFFKSHQDFKNDPHGKSEFKVVLTNFRSWVTRINRQYFVVLDKFLNPKTLNTSILLSIFSVKPLLAQLKVNIQMMQQKVQACLNLYSNKDFRILLHRFKAFLEASDEIQRIIEIVNKSKHKIDDLFQDIERERDLDNEINRVRQKGINKLKKVIEKYSDNNLQDQIVDKVTSAINEMADRNIDAYNHLKGAKNIMRRIHSTVLDTQSSVTPLGIQNISTMVKIFAQVLAQAQQFDSFAANFLQSGDLINDDLRNCIIKYQQEMQTQRSIVQQLQNKFINTILQEVVKLLKMNVQITFAIDQSSYPSRQSIQNNHTQNFQNINHLMERICDNLSDQKIKTILSKLVKESKTGYMRLEEDVSKIKKILHDQKNGRKQTSEGQCFFIDNQDNLIIIERLNKYVKQYKERLKNLILKQEQAYFKFNNIKLKSFKTDNDPQIHFIEQLELLAKKINNRRFQESLQNSPLFAQIQHQSTLQHVVNKLPSAKDAHGQPLIQNLQNIKAQLHQINKNNQLAKLIGNKIEVQNPLIYQAENMASIYQRAYNIKNANLINDMSKIMSQTKAMRGLSVACNHPGKASLMCYAQKVIILALLNGLDKQDLKILQNPQNIKFPQKDYDVETIARKRKYFDLLTKIISSQNSLYFVQSKIKTLQVRIIEILDNFALLKQYQNNTNNSYYMTTKDLDKFVQILFSQIFTPSQFEKQILQNLQTIFVKLTQSVETKLNHLESTVKRIKVDLVKNRHQQLINLNHSFLEKLQQQLRVAIGIQHSNQETNLQETFLSIYAQFVLGVAIYLQSSEQDCYVVLNSSQQPIWVSQIKYVDKGIGPQIGILNMQRGKFVNNFKKEAAKVIIKQIKSQKPIQKPEKAKKEKKEKNKKQNSQQIQDIEMEMDNQFENVNNQINDQINDDIDENVDDEIYDDMNEQFQQQEEIQDIPADLDQQMQDNIAVDLDQQMQDDIPNDVEEVEDIPDIEAEEVSEIGDQFQDQPKRQKQKKGTKNIQLTQEKKKDFPLQQSKKSEQKKVQTRNQQANVQNSPYKVPNLSKGTQLPKTHNMTIELLPTVTTLMNLRNFLSFVYQLRSNFLDQINYLKIGQYFNKSQDQDTSNYVLSLLKTLDEFILQSYKENLKGIKSTKVYNKLVTTLTSIQNRNWEALLGALQEKNHKYTILGFNRKKQKALHQQFKRLWIMPLKNDPFDCLKEYLYHLVQEVHRKQLDIQDFLKQCCSISYEEVGKNLKISVLSLKDIHKEEDLWTKEKIYSDINELNNICQQSQNLQDNINLLELSLNLWHKIIIQEKDNSSTFDIPLNFSTIKQWQSKLSSICQKQSKPQFIYFMEQHRNMYKNQIKNIKRHKGQLQDIRFKVNSANIIGCIQELGNIYNRRLKQKHNFYFKRQQGKYNQLLLDIYTNESINIPENQFTLIWQLLSEKSDKTKSLIVSQEKLIDIINELSRDNSNFQIFKSILEILQIENYLLDHQDDQGKLAVFGGKITQIVQRVLALRNIQTSQEFNIQEFSRDMLKIHPKKEKYNSYNIQLKKQFNKLMVPQQIFSRNYYQNAQTKIKQIHQKFQQAISILLTKDFGMAVNISLVFWKIQLNPQNNDSAVQSFTRYCQMLPQLNKEYQQFETTIKLQNYEQNKQQSIRYIANCLKEQDNAMKTAGNVLQDDIFTRIAASKNIYKSIYQYKNKNEKLNFKDYSTNITNSQGAVQTYLCYYSFIKQQSFEQFLKLFISDSNSRGQKINKAHVIKFLLQFLKNYQSDMQNEDGDENIVIDGDEIIERIQNILEGQANQTQIIYQLLKAFYKFNFDKQDKDLQQTINYQNRIVKIWSQQCQIFQAIEGLINNEYSQDLKMLINYDKEKQELLTEKSKALADLQRIKITSNDTNHQRFTELFTFYMDQTKLPYYPVFQQTGQICLCVLPKYQTEQIKIQLKNLGFSKQFSLEQGSNGIQFIKLKPVQCKLIIQANSSSIDSVNKEDLVNQYSSNQKWKYDIQIYRNNQLKPIIAMQVFNQKTIPIEITSSKNKNDLKVILTRSFKDKKEKICQDKIKGAKGHNQYTLSNISKQIDDIAAKIKIQQLNKRTVQDANEQLKLLKSEINKAKIHKRLLTDLQGPKIVKIEDLAPSSKSINEEKKKIRESSKQTLEKIESIIKKRQDSLPAQQLSTFQKVSKIYLEWILKQVLLREQIQNRLIQSAKVNYQQKVQEFHTAQRKFEDLQKQKQELQQPQHQNQGQQIEQPQIVMPKATHNQKEMAQSIGEQSLKQIKQKGKQYSEAFLASLLQHIVKLQQEQTLILML